MLDVVEVDQLFDEVLQNVRRGLDHVEIVHHENEVVREGRSLSDHFLTLLDKQQVIGSRFLVVRTGGADCFIDRFGVSPGLMGRMEVGGLALHQLSELRSGALLLLADGLYVYLLVLKQVLSALFDLCQEKLVEF